MSEWNFDVATEQEWIRRVEQKRHIRQELTAGEMRMGVRGRSISRQEVFDVSFSCVVKT